MIPVSVQTRDEIEAFAADVGDEEVFEHRAILQT